MDRVLRPGGEIVISSRLVDDGGFAAPFWKAVAPLARAIGWSSDFKVSRLTDWGRANRPLRDRPCRPGLFQGGPAEEAELSRVIKA